MREARKSSEVLCEATRPRCGNQNGRYGKLRDLGWVDVNEACVKERLYRIFLAEIKSRPQDDEESLQDALERVIRDHIWSR